jgi:hypothetical protein
MTTTGYTFIGWIVWQLGSRILKRKIADNKHKLSAAGVVLLVLAGGIAAAKAGASDD